MRKILMISLLTSTAATAQVSAPLVSHPSHTGTTEHLHTIALRAQSSAYAVREFRPDRNHEIPKSQYAQSSQGSHGNRVIGTAALSAAGTAPVAYNQTATFRPLNAPIGANFEALGVGTPGFTVSAAPPDTTLAVSPTQIVQWVNSQIGIYDKAGNSLLPAPGFIQGNALWQSLPSTSLCKTYNRGDPIVQYDRIAKRWIFSQFAFNASFTSNAQCFAVSQTDNALGAYNLYEYSFGGELPDYGKLGVWPDAYYMTYNMFAITPSSESFTGGRACAYDRPAMIAGQPATQICFNSTNRWSFLPSDLDGPTLPPAGTPNIHVSWNWVFTPTPPYTLQLTKFVPNFQSPALSTFDDGFGGAVFSFVGIQMDSGTLAACNDLSGSCAPQLGTTNRLDTLADRPMYRLVYRNFGTYDALLFTQSVDAQTGSTANLRWWEIRSPAAISPVVYQNSNFIPDTTARWMGSAAFDKLGNIGIGYSASSTTINPAIRVSGRLKNDPKNLLRTELSVIAGTGSQTGTLRRWGDYSTMQIDPANECTFWYTTQYIGSNGTFNWRTRIASFKFPNCS